MGAKMSDITNRLGLPTFISDYTWDGSNASANNQVVNVTSGALSVALTDGSIDINPATSTQFGSAVMPSNTPTTVCTLSTFGELYSIQASASAGPVKVELQKNGLPVVVRFFNSAFPNTDMTFPTGYTFSGTLDIVMTNLYSESQTGYASIFYA